jgi:hypothetical protein
VVDSRYAEFRSRCRCRHLSAANGALKPLTPIFRGAVSWCWNLKPRNSRRKQPPSSQTQMAAESSARRSRQGQGPGMNLGLAPDEDRGEFAPGRDSVAHGWPEGGPGMMGPGAV